jgi:putative phosphoribosyl transferase
VRDEQDQSDQEQTGQTPTRRWNVEIPIDSIRLAGFLDLPVRPRGAVLFAHGSGSGRLSPRNQYVASVLVGAGFATLLLDLLTETEALDRQFVFDIPLLAARLRAATLWVRNEAATRNLPIGYFGASTGAGAALVAAAGEGQRVSAVVSRGGRPDLAGDALLRVTAPTLLIVGGLDEPVISLNKLAYDELRTTKRLVIVPGATHLFEEPGTLEQVAGLACDWFTTYLQLKATA